MKEEGPVFCLLKAKQPAPATGHHHEFRNVGHRRLEVASRNKSHEAESEGTFFKSLRKRQTSKEASTKIGTVTVPGSGNRDSILSNSKMTKIRFLL
jgi:hypothetical protein